MTLKTIERFLDRTTEKVREIGEEFEADKERATFLIGLGYVEELTEEVTEEVTEEKPKKVRKSAKKK